ncbi:dTDP-4-dehydrorhamnose 3,5-epimerase [Paenibacillus taichungensis]|uniref:dTDP-4-dehydrorhamnose 3,5-epimerase n=1 Tax=Paenibacillus taichungensis TaxID=484184 RepID=A0A329QF22_9BACL|nr:dTDP-4-dehydrorhamnose 3,5-epimerase [Paenibacillus taichungensis]RAW10906.1 dTDP-4-dehydrorhamnose 3,5-epimerase [Paenibacillus taichungensis]
MGNFKFTQIDIEGLVIVEPKLFGDERGYFMETYHEEEFKKNGISVSFVQDNQSMSKKGVLRGMHYQTRNPQGKLVRVLEGEVYDVAVDLRKGSPTFLKWHGINLSGTNRKQFFIPEGFAHGFLVLSDVAVFSYKCTHFYDPGHESGLLWNDPKLGIQWPLDGLVQPSLSDKDANWKPLS